MAARRTRAIVHPVRLHIDGRDVEAEQGEPVAIALLAAGLLPWSRSIKYHRPRGPACLRGRCDGCLARIEGLPSRRTCLTPAGKDLRVASQPLLASARFDPLAAADVLFRQGLDHHRLGTQGPWIQRASVRLVRSLSGLGELPDALSPPPRITEHHCEVLVLGAGPAGLRAAEEATRAGARVLLADEAERPGGHLLDWPGSAPRLDALAARLRAVERLGLLWMPAKRALGVYEEPGRGSPLPVPGHPDPLRDAIEEASTSRPTRIALLCGPGELLLVHFEALILATGQEMGAPPLTNGDLPGVYTARAGAIALRHGLLLGERIALLGSGPWTDVLEAALHEAGAEPLRRPLEEVRRLHAAGGRLASVHFQDGTRWPCDAALVEPPPSADVRLGAQAGASTRWAEGGLFVEADPLDGSTRQTGLWAVGSLCGPASSPEAEDARAAEAGRAAARFVARGPWPPGAAS